MNVLGIAEGSNIMMVVFFRLMVLSLVLGYLSSDYFIGGGLNGVYMFGNSHMDYHFTSQILKLFRTLGGLLGLLVSVYLLLKSIAGATVSIHKGWLKFFSYRFYFDVMISYLTLNVMVFSNRVTFQLIDKGLLELLGRRGSSE